MKMKDAFESLAEFTKKSIKYDPWAEERGIEGYAKELKVECEELLEALENNDLDNFKEELGDVLADWMHICIHAENNGMFTTKEVIDMVRDKFERRKPYVVEGVRASKQVMRETWQRVKHEEKLEKQNHQQKRLIRQE